MGAINCKVIIAMLTVVLALAVGQLLFKATAMAWAADGTLFSTRVLTRLFPSLVVYGLATLAWIWVLQTVPLRTAYPFMALAFAFVPIGAYLIFKEVITPVYWVGTFFIVVGVVITAIAR
ncbi:MAG TPA: hypothetical protein VJP80_00545 [Candidatus Saccharimonadales bacterium]|nr:hypothetical protein [Candidatus Saccharimonadales bacterium]